MKKIKHIGKHKDRKIADQKVTQRIRQIGELSYINRHGFNSLNRSIFDGLCEGNTKTIESHKAKAFIKEITRCANSVKRAMGKPTFDRLQEIYNDSHFKPFSIFQEEMGKGFVVRIRVHQNPYTSNFKEGEEDAVKLILLRVYNEISF